MMTHAHPKRPYLFLRHRLKAPSATRMLVSVLAQVPGETEDRHIAQILNPEGPHTMIRFFGVMCLECLKGLLDDFAKWQEENRNPSEGAEGGG